MHRILALCTAIALYSCGSDEEPVFRPTIARPKARSVRRARTFFFATHLPRRRNRQRVWNLRGEAISGSLAGETLTQIPGYSRRYDRDLYISNGYTQSSKIWFPQTPGIDDCFHPKDMSSASSARTRPRPFPSRDWPRAASAPCQRRFCRPRYRRRLSERCAHRPGLRPPGGRTEVEFRAGRVNFPATG